jgi:hypothetical protein
MRTGGALHRFPIPWTTYDAPPDAPANAPMDAPTAESL